MEPRVQLANLLSNRATPRLALGVDALDHAIGGGVPLGGVTEIVSEQGRGGWWFASRVLAAVSKPVGVLNHDNTLHPPGLTALGVNIGRALVVQTESRRDALWSLERMAKNPDLGATVCWMTGLSDVEQRRLQLASERSGQIVLMLTNEQHAGRASWGALRIRVEGLPTIGGDRRLRITPMRGRGGIVPAPIELEVEHGTNAVRRAAVVSQPTHHTSLRSAGA